MNSLKIYFVSFCLFVVFLNSSIEVTGSAGEPWRAPQGRGRTGFDILNVYGGNSESINASETALQFEMKTYAAAAASWDLPLSSNYNNQSAGTNNSKSS